MTPTAGVSSMVERVAEAIEAVDLFSRFNDWTSDHVPGLPIEICHHGEDDESEIIIVARYPAAHGEQRALDEELGMARAKAAILAMREPTEEMVQAVAVSPAPRHRWQAMIDTALGQNPLSAIA